MANSTADGSVVIDVNMDVSQAEKRLGKLRDNIKKTEKEIADATAARDEAQKKLDNSPLEQEQKKLQDMMDARKKAAEVESSLVPISKEISALEAKLSEQQQNHLRTEENIKRTKEAIISAEKELSTLESSPKNNERYKKRVEELNEFLHVARPAVGNMETNLGLYNREIQNTVASLDQLKERADKISLESPENVSTDEEVRSQGEKIKSIQAEWNKAQKDVERYTKQIEKANEKLDGQKTEAGILTQEIDKSYKSQGLFKKAAEATETSMNRLGKRILGLASSALVFNVISRALTSLQQLTMKYIKTNDEARQAIAQMKGALLTLAQPLIEVLIPAFTLLVNILTQIITAVAQFVSMLFGKTLKQSKDGAKALHKEANAIGAVGEAADEAAGSLAGFDEINTINTENAKGAGGVGGAGDEIMPDFDLSPGKYKDMIDELMVYLSGALLVIGAILLFSGANIPLGLGLMVLGAAVLAQEIAENWGAVDGKINEAVQRIFMILGGALLVLGAILCFSGANIPLGIGLMILGATMLAAAATLNWGSTGEELRNALATLFQIIGPMIAIIGVLLAVTGHLLLGIGLIIAGVALFTAGEAAGEAGDFIENIRSKLSDALGVIGAFLSVVGILLIVTGHFLTGLGVLIAGIAALEYSEVRDDEGMTMQDKIKTVLEKTLEAVSPMIAIVGLMLLLVPGQFLIGLALLIAGIAIFEYSKVKDDGGMSIQEKIETVLKNTLKIASTFLLVLGLILLLIPPMWPTAFALIAAGVVGLVTATALDSDAIKNKLKQMWQGIQNWWNSGEGPKKFLTIEYWKGLGKDVIDGLLGGLKDAWDGLTSWFSGVWDDLFGNRKVSVDVKGTSSSGNYNSSSRTSYRAIPEISDYNIPALAQGAVIPPNREFMAVLGDQRHGTNLEAPEDLIRKIVREEAGGNDNTALLQSILLAIKDGHIIMVDGSVFGRTAIKTINSVNTSAGKQLLLI